MRLINDEKIHRRFMINHHHTIDALINPVTATCDLLVLDSRLVEVYRGNLTEHDYTNLLNFLSKNDHRDSIKIAAKTFKLEPCLFEPVTQQAAA